MRSQEGPRIINNLKEKKEKKEETHQFVSSKKERKESNEKQIFVFKSFT